MNTTAGVSVAVNAFVEQLARFGWGRLAAILGLTAGAAAALVMFTLTMNGANQSLLYAGLAPADAASVTERLDQAGISYELRDGGSAVYVASSDVDDARVRIASGGALGFGSVGYEIFDESDALGTTSFVQNVNARRALEGELARSINTLTNISGARVHLVLPERRLFSRDQQEPSASVVISVNGQMSSGQVATIRNLVATAVPGLSANRITLADDTGRLLASPSDGDMASTAALEDRRADVEERLRTRILDLVEGVVGPGAARVAVTAELDHASSTSTQLQFDPEGQVEVSRRQTTEESEEPLNDGAVSVSENQPDGAGGEPSAAQLARSSAATTERNYENSQTTTTTVREAGQLTRLAVSVVVDQITTRNEDGSFSFEPRQDMDQIRSLVAAAAGMSLDPEVRAENNQILEVSQMQFSRPDLTLGTPARSGFQVSQLDFMRIAEIAVLFITAVLIIFLVARPLIKGAIAGGDGGQRAIGSNVSANAAALTNSTAMLPEDGSAPAMLEDAGEDNIDIAQIDGSVKKSSLRKVAELVDNHPDETIGILRTWMHENA
ncbi:flagellar M-ring protein FliF [Maricaulaceae bacterium NA33B04]|nr:flagellar M-ring protein FliF [Maricaulaceae bacterium NA33B04]